VSLRELAEWIKNIDDNYYIKDANKQFALLDTDKDGFVTSKEYAKSMGLDGKYVLSSCVYHVCMTLVSIPYVLSLYLCVDACVYMPVFDQWACMCACMLLCVNICFFHQ